MKKWLMALGAVNLWYNRELTDLTRIVRREREWSQFQFQPMRTALMADQEMTKKKPPKKQKLCENPELARTSAPESLHCTPSTAGQLPPRDEPRQTVSLPSSTAGRLPPIDGPRQTASLPSTAGYDPSRLPPIQGAKKEPDSSEKWSSNLPPIVSRDQGMYTEYAKQESIKEALLRRWNDLNAQRTSQQASNYFRDEDEQYVDPRTPGPSSRPPRDPVLPRGIDQEATYRRRNAPSAQGTSQQASNDFRDEYEQYVDPRIPGPSSRPPPGSALPRGIDQEPTYRRRNDRNVPGTSQQAREEEEQYVDPRTPGPSSRPPSAPAASQETDQGPMFYKRNDPNAQGTSRQASRGVGDESEEYVDPRIPGTSRQPPAPPQEPAREPYNPYAFAGPDKSHDKVFGEKRGAAATSPASWKPSPPKPATGTTTTTTTTRVHEYTADGERIPDPQDSWMERFKAAFACLFGTARPPTPEEPVPVFAPRNQQPNPNNADPVDGQGVSDNKVRPAPPPKDDENREPRR